MRAFDFVMTLYSFVYALAVAQILSTVGDMIRAGKRLRFSWLNAGWMLNILLTIVAWWLSLWDLRLARMVSAPIPAGRGSRPSEIPPGRRPEICRPVRCGVRAHHWHRLSLWSGDQRLVRDELGDAANDGRRPRRGGDQ